MDRSIFRKSLALSAFFPLLLSAINTQAAAPSAAQALGLKPIQADVDIDQPTDAELENCNLKANAESGAAGWYVYNGAGQLLRRFLDTNKDNKLDQWCYYKGGIEVYRDIDADFNGKADQYRWLGTAGIRWGVDKDEDGTIDQWRMISAEEVTSEVVAALRSRDKARFARLLLSSSELQSLGLGEVQAADLAKKAAAAAAGFDELTQKQTAIGSDSRWMHFGASPPGVLPAGFEGSMRDVTVYDNVSAIVETAGQHEQISIGTLVQCNGGWRVIDLPASLTGSSAQVAGGYFFQQSMAQQLSAAPSTPGGLNEATQKLVLELEEVDSALERASSSADLARLNEQRANVLESLANQSTDAEERETWIRQYSDTVSAAAQSGGFPAGVQRLKSLSDRLEERAAGANLTGYVKFRYLSAAYGASLQAEDADYAKIQEEWQSNLLAFVRAYSKCEDAPEAMLQLAVGEEFAGKTTEAVQWYARVVSDYADSPQAKKAAGAKRRLEAVGNPIQIAGNSLDGKQVSLAAYRGRTVLIHYWATWCEPCKQDLDLLKQMQAKYASRGFTLIGVNLDSDRTTALQFLQREPLLWPQLYEEGGLDSRLAVEMGILTLPTMLLVDREGKVANRNIHAGELDEELSKILR